VIRNPKVKFPLMNSGATMNAKYILLYLPAMIMLMLVGCHEMPLTVNPITTPPDDYFPLHTGNQWVYQWIADSGVVLRRDTIVVRSTTILSSQSYYLVETHRQGR